MVNVDDGHSPVTIHHSPFTNKMTYLIYDTALNGPYTCMLLQKAYPVHQSFFKGTKDEALSDAAPYLFEVDEWVYEKINGPLVSLKAIIILRSGESIERLCMHFKNFIYQKINGRENYSRFWDARVLNKFLQEWPTLKVEEFFEDIESFSFISEEENTAIRLTSLHGKLQRKIINRSELFGTTNIETEQTREIKQNNNEESAGKEISDQTNKPRRRFFFD